MRPSGRKYSPTGLPPTSIFLILCLSVSFVVCLIQTTSTSFSLRITRRLWNELPASLHQPRTNLSISASPNSLSGTSSIGSVDSPLSSFITPSLSHSKLQAFSSSRLTPRIPRTVCDTSEHIRFLLFSFLFSTFYFLVPCGRLS